MVVEVSREKVDGRVEEVVVRTRGAWHEACIIGWDGEPRTVWKYPRLEQAQEKAATVKVWLAEGRLW